MIKAMNSVVQKYYQDFNDTNHNFLGNLSSNQMTVIVAVSSFIILSTLFFRSGADEVGKITLKSIDFSKLATLDVETSRNVVDSLSSVGALKITNIPNFRDAHVRALNGLSECYAESLDDVENGLIFTSEMDDGSKRVSMGSRAIRGVNGKIQSRCGDSSKDLRDLINLATRQLFLTLDQESNQLFQSIPDNLRTLEKNFYLMKPYQSYREILDLGEHLEHIHTYYNTPTHRDKPTLALHTDAGLMIAMTSGLYKNVDSTQFSSTFSNGLYIQVPTGEMKYVESTVDDLIIMIGEGGQRWLSPRHNRRFRAVPHSLYIDLGANTDATRSWYGKMILPPSDAYLYMSNVTYGTYRSYELEYATANRESSTRKLTYDRYSSLLVPSACGGDITQFALTAATACTTSGNPGIICWMGCRSVASLSCGQQAVCATPAGVEISGSISDMTATPQCLSPASHTTGNTTITKSSTTLFCEGTGTSMSMTGFIRSNEKDAQCFVYLFPTWILDSKVKFAFSCIGTILLGILLHAITMLRGYINLKTTYSIFMKRMMTSLLYFLQVIVSYVLMLLAMTYSIELFFMVCIGLTTGYILLTSHTIDSNTGKTLEADTCCVPDNEDVPITSPRNRQLSKFNGSNPLI